MTTSPGVAFYRMERINVNAQPYYDILDPKTGESKVPSRGYNLDVEAYLQFLIDGLK